MRNTVYASFIDRDQAIKAAGALLDFGVINEDLSVIGQGTKTDMDQYLTAHDGVNGTIKEVENVEIIAKQGLTVTTPADAAFGAAMGAGIGLSVGLVAGLAALVVPGVGLVIGGGALAIALAGAGLSTGAGALAGGVVGYLKDQGVTDDSVAVYSDAVTNGGAIIALTLPSDKVDEIQACELLAKYGAENIRVFCHNN